MDKRQIYKRIKFSAPGRKIQNVLTVGEEVVYLGGIKKTTTTESTD